MTLIPAWVDGELVPVEKLDAHRRGLRHKAISVFLLCGDDVLIQQRAVGKYHSGGLWANTCCSHPDWGESAEDCAHRRLFEELGVAGVPLIPRTRVEYRADVGQGLLEHELVDIFVAHVAVRPVVSPNPDEVMAVSWVDKDALLDRVIRRSVEFAPWLSIYLQGGYGGLFDSECSVRETWLVAGQGAE